MVTTMNESGDATWRVREFSPADKPSLLRLSRLHYGDKEQADEAYVDWLYNASTGDHSFIAIAVQSESGEVRGFSFQVPFQVRAMRREGICRLGCNALVHPAYRRQGVYAALSRLVESSITDTLFTYGFPKPRALAAHEKVGKFQIGPIPLLVRPLNIQALTRKRLKNPLIRWAVNAGWWAAAGSVWRPRPVRRASSSIEVKQRAEPGAQFNSFWARVQDKYEIIIPRDSQFLRWRFIQPQFRRYLLFTAEVDGDVLGYIALRITEIEGISTGLIMDLLVEPTRLGEEAGLLLIERAVDESEATGAALSGCLMLPHTQEYGLLKRMGYVEPPERFSPQAFRLMATCLSPEIPATYLAERTHWFMTMANHDAV